ncbi:MAG: chromosomal replication initiator protein DnaA [Treponema sp.]
MNSCDYRIFWEEAVKQLREEIGESIDLWFSRISYERSSESHIVLSVPSAFFRDQVRQRYEVSIEKKLYELFGTPIQLSFEVKHIQPAQDSPANTALPVGVEHSVGKAAEEQHTGIIPEAETPPQQNRSLFTGGAKKKATEAAQNPHPLLNDRYTFDKFVIDDDNPLPANAALAVSKNPGSSYNPLLIYGGVGLGKTHLMQAIGNELHNRGLKIMYTTAENFTNEFIEFLHKNKMHEFKNKYRNADALLIDDIHFFDKKEGTQEELFHTFNALYESKRQIVFTCDRPVEELKNLSERLRSRFTRGLSVDLKIPSYETRCAILFKKIEADNLAIPKEVVELLAKNISSNVRDLEGALTKLRAYSELTGPITMEIAQRLMQDVFGSPRQHNISVDSIQKIVADYFNISFVDLKSKKRTKNISFPRQVAMYLAREMTDFSTTELGVEFGGRDHSTIMHGHQKIETQIAITPSLEVNIAELKKRITNAAK